MTPVSYLVTVCRPAPEGGVLGSFHCGAGARVLLAMERRGQRLVAVGCRGGGCGVCKVLILSGRYQSGKVSRSVLSVGEEEAGFALACKVMPESDLVVQPVHKAGRAARRTPSIAGGRR